MSKTVLITGSSTGIGKAGALELGRRGWKVFVHARSEERGKTVLDELKNSAPNANFSLVTGDVSSMEQVKSLAKQVKEQTDTLDVLWNNAGLMLNERQVSVDGWEKTMAINHLAPFVLTRELIPLIESVQGRVITTSSGAHYFGSFNWDDWMDEKSKYNSFKIYSKSKLANVLFTRELAKRIDAKGITAHCFHPGMVRTDFGKQTRGVPSQGSWYPRWMEALFTIDTEAGADTGVFLAENPSTKDSNGKYWFKRKVRRTNRFDNDQNAAKLWELSEKATN